MRRYYTTFATVDLPDDAPDPENPDALAEAYFTAIEAEAARIYLTTQTKHLEAAPSFKAWAAGEGFNARSGD